VVLVETVVNGGQQQSDLRANPLNGEVTDHPRGDEINAQGKVGPVLFGRPTRNNANRPALDRLTDLGPAEVSVAVLGVCHVDCNLFPKRRVPPASITEIGRPIKYVGSPVSIRKMGTPKRSAMRIGEAVVRPPEQGTE
jgi:hypothetical protein